MSILSGYGKFKRYVLTDSGYKLCSQWTSSNTVHFDDGKTAQTKLGAISGITDSLTATSSNIALSAKAGKSLQDQVTELNTDINILHPIYASQLNNAKALNITCNRKEYATTTYLVVIIVGGTIAFCGIINGYTTSTALERITNRTVKLYENSSYPISAIDSIAETDCIRTKITMSAASEGYRGYVIPLYSAAFATTTKYTAYWAIS